LQLTALADTCQHTLLYQQACSCYKQWVI